MGLRRIVLVAASALLLYASSCDRIKQKLDIGCVPGYSNEEFDSLSEEFNRVVKKDGKINVEYMNKALREMGYKGPELKEGDLDTGYAFANNSCKETQVLPAEVNVNGTKETRLQVLVTAKSVKGLLEKEGKRQ